MFKLITFQIIYLERQNILHLLISSYLFLVKAFLCNRTCTSIPHLFRMNAVYGQNWFICLLTYYFLTFDFRLYAINRKPQNLRIRKLALLIDLQHHTISLFFSVSKKKKEYRIGMWMPNTPWNKQFGWKIEKTETSS